MYHLHGELPVKVTTPDADKIKKLSKLDNKDVSNVCQVGRYLREHLRSAQNIYLRLWIKRITNTIREKETIWTAMIIFKVDIWYDKVMEACFM